MGIDIKYNLSVEQLLGRVVGHLYLCNYQAHYGQNFRWLTTSLDVDTSKVQQQILDVKNQLSIWINSIFSNISAGLVSNIINSGTTFQSSIDAINSICQKSLKIPITENNKKQIVEVLGVIDTTVKSFQNFISDSQGEIQKFAGDLTSLNSSLREAVIDYQSNFKEVKDLAEYINNSIDLGCTVVNEINNDVIILSGQNNTSVAFSSVTIAIGNMGVGYFAAADMDGDVENIFLVKLLQAQFQKPQYLSSFNALTLENKQVSYLLLSAITAQMIISSLTEIINMYDDIKLIFNFITNDSNSVNALLTKKNILGTDIIKQELFSSETKTKMENILKVAQNLVAR